MSLWGFHISPKWFTCEELLLLSVVGTILPFSIPKIRAAKRIGPHNMDILSIIFGSILGDASGEHRSGSTRFVFYQEASHSAYLLWLHNLISALGYCPTTIPTIFTRLAPGGKLRYVIRFKTFSFISFNWIYEAFYVNGVKVVPPIIVDYLTPLALAIWIMDASVISSSDLKIATNSFTLLPTGGDPPPEVGGGDVQFLCDVLNSKYHLDARVHSAGVPNQYCIYITKQSMPRLAAIIGPHMHPSMIYKLNGYL